MANPTLKGPEMTALLEALFGRTTAITSNGCVFCGQPATDFRDQVSLSEYKISGLCQQCQDKTFGENE